MVADLVLLTNGVFPDILNPMISSFNEGLPGTGCSGSLQQVYTFTSIGLIYAASVDCGPNGSYVAALIKLLRSSFSSDETFYNVLVRFAGFSLFYDINDSQLDGLLSQ